MKKLSRRERSNLRLEILKKVAQEQHGIFQNFPTAVTNYKTRDNVLALRSAEREMGRDTESLYGVGPTHEASYVPTEHVSGHLSTRYSPDRPGVQAMRVSDGVFQDPYTRKIYDYNEGFSTEDGRSFPGGSAAFQTDLIFASENAGGIKKIAADSNYKALATRHRSKQ